VLWTPVTFDNANDSSAYLGLMGSSMPCLIGGTGFHLSGSTSRIVDTEVGAPSVAGTYVIVVSWCVS
jgi:hypothetical protein